MSPDRSTRRLSIQASAIVASPPKRSLPCTGAGMGTRYQTSRSCSGVGRSRCQRPRASSDAAALPGTRAGCQSGAAASQASGEDQRPGAETHISQPAERGRTEVAVSDTISDMDISDGELGCDPWRLNRSASFATGCCAAFLRMTQVGDFHYGRVEARTRSVRRT